MRYRIGSAGRYGQEGLENDCKNIGTSHAVLNSRMAIVLRQLIMCRKSGRQ